MIKILGTGSGLPEFELNNEILSKMVDTTDEWIVSRTGIKTRRILTAETQADIGVTACKNALENAKVKASEIDLIICATFHGEHIVPSTACLIQAGIGANCPAFDINAACSGFVYGLQVAAAYLQSGLAQKVLLVAAEAVSRTTDYTDRASCVLFGDGAGAVVLEKGEELKAITLTAKGEDKILVIPNSHGNFPHSEHPQTLPYLKMNGQEVYKFAINAIVKDVENVLKHAGKTMQNVDFVLFHQANLRIIEAASQKLCIPPEKIMTNIEKYGNTSAACIPLLLDEAIRCGKIKSGSTLLLSAFGGGMTTGAAILQIS